MSTESPAITVRPYSPADDAARWDEFVTTQARNATFLHTRPYMDYHSHRFTDCSLMVYKGPRLMALLPGNRTGSRFTSHGGLTYGGLLYSTRATMDDVSQAFRAINAHLASDGITEVVYKPVPHIYHLCPSEEDLYALTMQCGAQLTARAISSAIAAAHPVKFFDIRKSGIRKATNAGVTVAEATDFAPFWQLLTDNLMERHGVAPVHTLQEMQLLHSRFPAQIRLFTATEATSGRCLAGVLIYDTAQVAHAQYISASADGRRCGALDLLFAHLIHHEYAAKPYFDFGISTEQGGRVLNSTLIYQKEGFGARGICYDTYTYHL